MPQEPKRVVEVRLIVLVFVDLADLALIEAIAASGGESVSDIVSAEIISNLESIPYVEAVTTSEL